jgi:misacylated tRNA(Ala) deacylase
MTDLLYQEDSYIREFPARIEDFDPENQALILDRTAFYPGGGGQPADSGIIKLEQVKLPVKRARKSGADVLHIVEGDFGKQFSEQDVVGQLDWERRYQLMRTHTAMHILCGVIFRDYGASVTGGSMEPMAGRMDFEFETMRKELVQEIESAINLEVKNARPVRVDILPREEAFKIPDLIRTKINLLPEGIQQVRVVEIEGLDLQADGGTHVNNTSEVGQIEIVDYKSKGKINKRIYVRLVE